MTATLTVCGSAGTHPGPGRACSGYLLTAGDTRLLLDCGNGCLTNLQRVCDIADVDAVLLSHLHPDHYVDLYGMYYARRFHPDGPAPVVVYGPRGTETHVAQALTASGRDGLRQICRFQVVAAGDTLTIGPMTVRLDRANHPVETLACRVEVGERSVAYSADTHTSDEVVDLAREADLFVCDSTWLARHGPHPSGVHATGVEAGQMAADAGARRLLVTHVVPTLDPTEVAREAAGAYDGEILIAEDGQVLTL